MAPNRRKSKAPSAAAAAAARQKWKVGDLVLAKVKGFPAWPATISEPEKWGYKPDSKKVLVFFFGTKQIAFCSHVDIEAFTEEKKQTLQGKRYGKSADFVRAVQEITENYDKLKTQVQDDGFKHGVEDSVKIGEKNSSGSLSPLTTEIPIEHVPLIPKKDDSVTAKEISETSLPFDDVASVKDENQNSPYISSVSETQLESAHILQEKSISTDSLANVKQRRALSIRRSRTSRIDARRSQDKELPFDDSVVGRGCVLASSLSNASTGYIRPQISNPIPNSSPEDGRYCISSRECSSLNTSEDSSFDSTCIPEHVETADNSYEKMRLTKKRGLDIKAVFVKKKRKSNRKRNCTDGQKMSAYDDKGADIVYGVHNYRLNSPDACEKSNESTSNVDGDEFLPLVKRARVRMGKLSDIESHNDVLTHDVEEKSTNGCSLAFNVGLSKNFAHKVSSNCQNSTIITESADSAEAQVDCTVTAKEAELNNFCRGVPFEGVAGKEGVPPSKCFHQAFEGIPLGAPEESQQCTEEQLAKPSNVVVSGIFSFTEAAGTIRKNDVGEDALANNVDVACKKDMEEYLSSNAAIVDSPCIQESDIHLIMASETNQYCRSSQMVEKAAISTAHDSSDVNCLSLDIKELNGICANYQLSSNRSPQYNLKPSSDSSQNTAEHPAHKISSSESIEISKFVVRKDDNDASNITHNIDPVRDCEDEVLDSEVLLPSLSKKMPVHCMSAVGGELEFGLSLNHVTSTEVFDSKLGPSRPVSDTDECSGEKVVLRIQTSPSSVSGLFQPSLLASSLNSTNSNPNVSNPQNERLIIKREKGIPDGGIGRYGTSGSSGKVTNYVEAKASLTLFGNALGTLTRTKDSIGRATRMAIDCAKAGLAVKVVDTLSCALENESSLNRKIDLFFLVDSIMQCSRGLKGEVCGLYPSAIQAALPRLLSAAAAAAATASAGDAANENRRQCLKVLKLWLDRRILPDSVIRHHMRSLDSVPSVSYSSAPLSRRSSRTERAIHDPVREMEGMLVDEYGSNSSFQLSGFCMPRIRKVDFEGEDSDGENFEAVTPEHNSGTPEEAEWSKGGMHRHILEDVDGELEMEDVAPSQAEMNLSNDIGGINIQISIREANMMSLGGPPLPSDVPPSSPPLPTSPPPSHAQPSPPGPPQNNSILANPVRPPLSIHSMSVAHPFCPSHGHTVSLTKDHPLQPHSSVHPLPLSAAGCPPTVYPPVPAHPPTDMLANGPDLMLYGSRHSSAGNLPPVSPRAQPRQMGVQDPSTNCSFDSFRRPHLAAHQTNGHSINPSNGFRHSDGRNYDSRVFNARPPPLGPPNNYSYVHGNQRGHHSWREGPPRSYSSNYHRGPSRGDRNHYNDRNWRKPGSQERYGDRRYHGPPFPGDKGEGPYQLHPYVGPSNGNNWGGQGWGYPPIEMHHSSSMPVGPSSSEGPRYWHQ